MLRTKRKGLIASLALLAAAVSFGVTWGQPQSPPKGPPPDKKGGPKPAKDDELLKLLALQPVQRELEIIDDQMQDFRRIGDELKRKVAEAVGSDDPKKLPRDEQDALRERLKSKEAEWQQWVREEISNVLLPHQSRRLEQIALQLRGIDALNDPDLVKQLKLSQRQLDDIARLRQQEQQERDNTKKQIEQFVKGKEAGELRKEQELLIRAEFEQEARKVLTRDQTRHLEQLFGEPFDLSSLKGGGKPKPPKGSAELLPPE